MLTERQGQNPVPATFIGLDLAWSPRNNTAAAVITLNDEVGEGYLTDWRETLGSNQAILDFLTQHTTSNQNQAQSGTVLVAIDAPLTVPNETGSRPCDTALSRDFRRFEAGTHPANRTVLGKYGVPVGNIRGETLAAALEHELGLTQNPYLEKMSNTRQFFECFPHPAMITLFSLTRTLKYKRKLKREENDRKAAYQVFQSLLLSLENYEPKLKLPAELLSRNVNNLRGASLKHYEDLLDAVICAYVAYYCWYWGTEKYRVYGDIASGHILIPIPQKMW